jgi:protein-tyrosine phosphatase
MTVAATRLWSLPDTHNIRDLGGYALSNGGTTQWSRLLRGEALHPLTPESVDLLVQRGLTTVIDLRGPHETGLNPHPFRDHPAVAYRNIVLYEAMAPIIRDPAQFDMAQRYRDALDLAGPRIADVLRTIATAPAGIVLFHCTAGKDRTGVISALLLTLADVDRATIAADYALTATAGSLIRQLRENALANGGDPAQVDRMLASDEATILAMLAHLDTAHGGIDGYMDKIGITEAERETLVERLTKPSP